MLEPSDRQMQIYSPKKMEDGPKLLAPGRETEAINRAIF